MTVACQRAPTTRQQAPFPGWDGRQARQSRGPLTADLHKGSWSLEKGVGSGGWA